MADSHRYATTGTQGTVLRRNNRAGNLITGSVQLGVTHLAVGSQIAGGLLLLKSPQMLAQEASGASFIQPSCIIANADGTDLFTREGQSYADAGLTVDITAILGVSLWTNACEIEDCHGPKGFPWTYSDPDEINNYYDVGQGVAFADNCTVWVTLSDDVTSVSTPVTAYSTKGPDESSFIGYSRFGTGGDIPLPNCRFLSIGKQGERVPMKFQLHSA